MVRVCGGHTLLIEVVVAGKLLGTGLGEDVGVLGAALPLAADVRKGKVFLHF